MHSLPLFVRLNGRPVILLGDGDAASAKRRLLERAGAIVVGEEVQASLAIVALEDEVEAISATHRLKERGILVNAVDRPALCDFTLPAIVDRDPVQIAIGTGGASAGLAKALRQRLEALIPARLGDIAKGLSDQRLAMRQRWPDGVARRLAIDGALQAGGALDPLADHGPDVVKGWLAGAEPVQAQAYVELILRSDDPDDLTFREARVLASADTVIHAPRIPSEILNRARADARMEAGYQRPDPLPAGLTLLIRRG